MSAPFSTEPLSITTTTRMTTQSSIQVHVPKPPKVENTLHKASSETVYIVTMPLYIYIVGFANWSNVGQFQKRALDLSCFHSNLSTSELRFNLTAEKLHKLHGRWNSSHILQPLGSYMPQKTTIEHLQHATFLKRWKSKRRWSASSERHTLRHEGNNRCLHNHQTRSNNIKEARLKFMVSSWKHPMATQES